MNRQHTMTFSPISNDFSTQRWLQLRPLLALVLLLLPLCCSAHILTDHFDDDPACNHVECPQPPSCPADTRLKIISDDMLDELDDYEAYDDLVGPNNNHFSEMVHSTEYPVGILLESTASAAMKPSKSPTLREIRAKRSLAHRRKQSRWKRDVDFISIDLNRHSDDDDEDEDGDGGRNDDRDDDDGDDYAQRQNCCPEYECVCRDCTLDAGRIPHCAAGEVAVELRPALGTPGNCCARYKCVAETQCGALPQTTHKNEEFWKNACHKCRCYGAEELCIDMCDHQQDEAKAGGCYSDYLQRIMLEGEEWLEDEACSECSCEEGEKMCTATLCRAPKCKHPKKVKGRCCPVCEYEKTGEQVEEDEIERLEVKEDGEIKEEAREKAKEVKEETYNKKEEEKDRVKEEEEEVEDKKNMELEKLDGNKQVFSSMEREATTKEGPKQEQEKEHENKEKLKIEEEKKKMMTVNTTAEWFLLEEDLKSTTASTVPITTQVGNRFSSAAEQTGSANETTTTTPSPTTNTTTTKKTTEINTEKGIHTENVKEAELNQTTTPITLTKDVTTTTTTTTSADAYLNFSNIDFVASTTFRAEIILSSRSTETTKATTTTPSNSFAAMYTEGSNMPSISYTNSSQTSSEGSSSSIMGSTAAFAPQRTHRDEITTTTTTTTTTTGATAVKFLPTEISTTTQDVTVTNLTNLNTSEATNSESLQQQETTTATTKTTPPPTTTPSAETSLGTSSSASSTLESDVSSWQTASEGVVPYSQAQAHAQAQSQAPAHAHAHLPPTPATAYYTAARAIAESTTEAIPTAASASASTTSSSSSLLYSTSSALHSSSTLSEADIMRTSSISAGTSSPPPLSNNQWPEPAVTAFTESVAPFGSGSFGISSNRPQQQQQHYHARTTPDDEALDDLFPDASVDDADDVDADVIFSSTSFPNPFYYTTTNNNNHNNNDFTAVPVLNVPSQQVVAVAASTPQQQSRILQIFDKIDSVLFVALALGALLSLAVGLVIRHTRNRMATIYSSIPSSEASLNQNSTNTVFTV